MVQLLKQSLHSRSLRGSPVSLCCRRPILCVLFVCVVCFRVGDTGLVLISVVLGYGGPEEGWGERGKGTRGGLQRGLR